MKRILLTILQVGITVALLCYFFRKPEQRAQMGAALQSANYVWLIPAIVSIGIAFILQTQRWRLLLSVQGIHIGWWRTLRIYFIGAFFNLFLPGAIGGDVVKIFYTMREAASKKSAAVLSVLVDRMMGLIALVAVTVVLCGARIQLLLAHEQTRILLVPLVVILGGSIGLIVAGFLVDRFHLAKYIPRWLPLHDKILEFAGAFSVYARDGKVMALTFGLSIPAHLLIFLSFFFTAQAFGTFRGWTGLVDIFSVMPIIQTIAALPISFAGVGVREGMFQSVMPALFNIQASVAPMISIMAFLTLVFWGLIGGVIYLIYRPTGGLHIEEVEEEVTDIEHAIEEKVEKEG